MAHKFPVRIPKGYHLEVIPLFGGRGRITVTDGVEVILDVW